MLGPKFALFGLGPEAGKVPRLIGKGCEELGLVCPGLGGRISEGWTCDQGRICQIGYWNYLNWTLSQIEGGKKIRT